MTTRSLAWRPRRIFASAAATLVFVLGVMGVGLSAATPAAADDASTISSAVDWAEDQAGSTSWDGLCQQFVFDAYNTGASYNIGSGYGSAVGYWNGHTNGRHTDTDPPKGALVFWGATTTSMGHGLIDNPDGHVALALGGGSVISSEERSNTGVHTFTIAARNAAYYPYLGWMMPPGIAVPGGGSGSSGGSVGTSGYFGSDTLQHGQYLLRNQYILSSDARFALILQNDGNVVLYGYNYTALWSSGTGGSSGNKLLMQDDGNLVLYGASGAIWATGSSGSGAPSLKVQNDGNVVLYRPSGATWSSGTGAHPTINPAGVSQLSANGELLPGQYLLSDDHRYGLVLQNDGNLILYGPGNHILWSSGSGGHTPTKLLVQGDGNVVLYGTSGAYWSTLTAGIGSSTLKLQNDGNLVLYSASGATWSSGTGGQT